YEQEQRPTARKRVTGVALVTTALTTHQGAVRRAFGRLSPWILGRSGIQAKLGRTAGMLELAYKSGSLSKAKGSGQRLANPRLFEGGRLYDRLPRDDWAWVVWGTPGEKPPVPGDPAWCGIPVVFVPTGTIAEEGSPISRDKRVVLVRPDRYVAGSGSLPESIGQPGSMHQELRI
ncbi:MAG: hypothetical protein Q4P23_15215, partial [Micrococcaceae bacterium]|nr:hypothetical protein [Micrococcaceae bacterium]